MRKIIVKTLIIFFTLLFFCINNSNAAPFYYYVKEYNVTIKNINKMDIEKIEVFTPWGYFEDDDKVEIDGRLFNYNNYYYNGIEGKEYNGVKCKIIKTINQKDIREVDNGINVVIADIDLPFCLKIYIKNGKELYTVQMESCKLVDEFSSHEEYEEAKEFANTTGYFVGEYDLNNHWIEMQLTNEKPVSNKLNYTVKEYNNLIENQKVIAVMISQNSNELSITADNFGALIKEKLGYTVTSITKNETETLKSTNKVNTGAKIKVGNDEYTALIFGDANGDGDICDADDLMVIINDFLGKKLVTGVYRLAADLANKDGKSILDTDDLMQMINMYLGKLKGNLVEELPEDKNDIIMQINDRSKLLKGAGYSWNYIVYEDGSVKGEKWTSGSVVNFVSKKIKEYTVKLENDELQFLKEIENKYTQNETADSYFDFLRITKDKEIYVSKLNVEDRQTLKNIINKIIEFREGINLYVPNYVVGENQPLESRDYDIDVHLKKVTYTNKIKTNGILNSIVITEKSLTEKEINSIIDIYNDILKTPEAYIFNGKYSSDDGYYATFLEDYGECIIMSRTKIATINSIVSEMDNLDGIKAEVKRGVSYSEILSNLESLFSNENISNDIELSVDDRVDLSQKGYEFVRSGKYLYLVISMGLCGTPGYELVVKDINIKNNHIQEVCVEELRPNPGQDMAQVVTHPYCVIRFNVEADDINVYNTIGEVYELK